MERKREEENGSALVQMSKKITTDDYSHDVDDPFICLICLELVHKPVVNACGHMFCFLCVHQSMNFGSESHCPLCRRQYMHFPRICEQLHFFLLKALPDAYRRRCKEAQDTLFGLNLWQPHPSSLDYDAGVHRRLAEEVQAKTISPQFDDGLQFYLNDVSGGDTPPSTPDSGKHSASVVLQLTSVDEEVSSVGSQGSLNGSHTGTSSSSSNDSKLVQSNQPEVRSINGVEDGVSSASTRVATSGLLCSLCKDLLCRPVVLNCGHVFCEGCVANKDGAQDSVLKCSTCGSFHPGPFPSVFLELHHYLDKTFTSEYARRQCEMELKDAEREKSCNTRKPENVQPTNKDRHEPKFISQRINLGVGCDGCGIYPMTGRRFKCQDCGQRPGYDLCLSCYESQRILLGRFNQKHTREHRMVEVGHRRHLLADQVSEIEDMEAIDDAELINGEITIVGRIRTWTYPLNSDL